MDEENDFWDKLPEERKESISGCLNRFVGFAQKISTFDPEKESNPKSKRDELENGIVACYKDSYNIFLMDFRIYFLEKEIRNIDSKEYANEAKKNLEEIISQKDQVDKIVRSMQEASAEKGVSIYAGIFQEEAERNKKTARNWLIASIFAFVCLIGGLTLIFTKLLITISGTGIAELDVESVFTRILLISFASIGLYQMLKNYNANMHQYSLNKHRENSLKTFRTFVDSTNDTEIKDAVLIQATKSIFEAGETGYVSKKAGDNTFEIISKLFRKGDE